MHTRASDVPKKSTIITLAEPSNKTLACVSYG